MYERFTDRARKVMALANQEAQRLNHKEIGSGDILLGLVKEGSGVGSTALKNLKVDLLKLRSEIEKRIKPSTDVMTMGKLLQTPAAKKVIEYTIEEARSLNHNYVGTEHVLLGLLRRQKTLDGEYRRTTAQKILCASGLKTKDVREEVMNLLGVEKEKKHNIKKVATKKKQRPVKCEFFEKQEFITQETGETEIRKTTPRGSMSEKEVKETIAKFLSDKEFVQATECSIEPFRNLKTPLIITKITVWYRDKDSS